MGSIEQALVTAGAEDDLQTILQVLEHKSVGFKRREAAAGPFASMDTTLLTGLNIRMLSVIKTAQQQQQQHQGWPLNTKLCVTVSILYLQKSLVALRGSSVIADWLFCSSRICI